jgi:aflatoxin B1 aldehyde reductase
MYRKRYFKDSTFEALKIIEPVVEKHGLTMIETALRWIIHHSALNIANGGHDGVIIGVSSVDQLDENLRNCKKGPLPQEVLEALDKAWLVSKPETPNYWHLDLSKSIICRAKLEELYADFIQNTHTTQGRRFLVNKASRVFFAQCNPFI